ncbi:methyltransferase domain-containing protein [Streptomyces profundus]|nr:methyltransferase domain-containing protein [Streptomyces sp. MA3_2.13]
MADQLGTTGAERSTFELLGKEWDLLPGAYAPRPGTGTEWYTTHVPYPRGGRFLEVGCGAGVTAVWAALNGCAHVTATDITESAVRNTALNAERHGVARRLRVLGGDVFEGLDAEDRFDVVFWNCSVIEAPEDFEFTRDVEWAIFDRGYAALGRYLATARGRLAPGGRALVTFNTLGDAGRLDQLAADAGVSLRRLAASPPRRLAGRDVTFKLLEILPRHP